MIRFSQANLPHLVVLWHLPYDLVCELELLMKVLLQRLQHLATEVPACKKKTSDPQVLKVLIRQYKTQM